jgi:Spy/CpxP family protein refolding chaperone
MFRKTIVFLVLSFLVFSSYTAAQTSQQPPMAQRSQGEPMGQRQGGMMRGMGMMQGMGMMDSDMMQSSTMLVHRALMGSMDYYLDRQDLLGLTEKQTEALREIRLDAANETKDIKSDLDVARIELQDMLDREPINVNAASRKLEEVHGLEAELQSEQIRAMVEARKVLTPKQKTLLESNGNQMMMEMGGAGQDNQTKPQTTPGEGMNHDHGTMQ